MPDQPAAPERERAIPLPIAVLRDVENAVRFHVVRLGQGVVMLLTESYYSWTTQQPYILSEATFQQKWKVIEGELPATPAAPPPAARDIHGKPVTDDTPLADIEVEIAKADSAAECELPTEGIWFRSGICYEITNVRPGQICGNVLEVIDGKMYRTALCWHDPPGGWSQAVPAEPGEVAELRSKLDAIEALATNAAPEIPGPTPAHTSWSVAYSIVAAKLAELTAARAEIEKVNALAREYGFGQGELDDDLAGCLRKGIERELTAARAEVERYEIPAACWGSFKRMCDERGFVGQYPGGIVRWAQDKIDELAAARAEIRVVKRLAGWSADDERPADSAVAELLGEIKELTVERNKWKAAAESAVKFTP